MSIKLISKHIGKTCHFYISSPTGTTVKGKILSIDENWIEVETNKSIELINADYISNIKIK